MTFDDDMVQFEFEDGIKRIYCKQLGIEWPPPQQFVFMGFIMELQRMSQITDGQRKTMSHIIRGAVYAPKGS